MRARERKLFRFLVMAGWFLAIYLSVAASGLAAPRHGSSDLSPVVLIEQRWVNAVDAISAKNLRVVNEEIFELEKLRNDAGYLALEDYSLYLITQGLIELKNRDIDSAAFYARKALQLSPNSPRVLFDSLGLVQATGVADSFSILSRAFKHLPGHFEIVVNFVSVHLYAVLLAFTIACYVVLLLFIALNGVTMLRRLAWKMPGTLRGVTAPVLLAVLLCAPGFFGILVALTVWSLLITWLIPARRWLVMHAAVLIVLWGAFAPLKENIGLWFQDKGVESMFRAVSGAYAHWDRAMLKELTERRPDDPLAFYAYGKVLRREAEYDAALKTFQIAARLMGNQPWTVVEEGIIAFLQKRLKDADALFEQAAEMGLDSPEFLFNYSKIKMELMQSESARDYLDRAFASNRELVAALGEREARLGIANPLTVAEISPPMKYTVSSALIPNPEAKERSDSVIANFFPWGNPMSLIVIGFAVLGIAIFRTEPDQRVRTRTLYADYRPVEIAGMLMRIVPGGAWILAGRPVVCLWMLSIANMIAMPLAGWPGSTVEILERFPVLRGYLVSIFGLFMLAVLYIGLHLKEERADA